LEKKRKKPTRLKTQKGGLSKSPARLKTQKGRQKIEEKAMGMEKILTRTSW